MDLTQEQILHMNDNYTVYFIPEQDRKLHGSYEGKEIVGNYKVVHNIHKCVEQFCDNYPTALSVAEHFNKALQDKSYLEQWGSPQVIVQSADDFYEEIEAVLGKTDDEDEGGVH